MNCMYKEQRSIEERTFARLGEVSKARVVITRLLLGRLLGVRFRSKVVPTLVFADKEVFHDHNEERRDKHHAGAYGVSLDIAINCIFGSVDLTANGSSDVSERDNGSGSDSALGMTSNVGREPRKHGGDGGKDTRGSDGQTDIAVDGG